MEALPCTRFTYFGTPVAVHARLRTFSLELHRGGLLAGQSRIGG